MRRRPPEKRARMETAMCSRTVPRRCDSSISPRAHARAAAEAQDHEKGGYKQDDDPRLGRLGPEQAREKGRRERARSHQPWEEAEQNACHNRAQGTDR